MSKNEELFHKTIAEVIPTLVVLDAEQFENNKRITFAEVQNYSIYVQKFIRVLFELADEKRKVVQHE